MKIKLRAIPRLFRYAFLNSIVSFLITLIAAHTFILPSDLGGEGESIANAIILTFAMFVSLGNLTYMLIPVKRIPFVNLLFAFTWFSVLSFLWIYFSPDGAGTNDQSIKYVFLFYACINALAGIGTAFWYQRVIIKILGPDPKGAIFSMHFLKRLFPKKHTHVLHFFLEGARSAGLETKVIKEAEKFLEKNEVTLCFDHIVTQLYKYKVTISNDYYKTIVKTGNDLNLAEEQYSYLEELIRSN
jgi:hypothetical protein